MKYTDLGLIEYQQAWDYQEEVFDQNIQKKKNSLPTDNVVIFCEHPHTITIGKNGQNSNLLHSVDWFRQKGVEIFNIDRGGDVTYHGPGQIVAYPIFDLETFGIGLRQYVHNIEEVMIQLLAIYNIKAERWNKATGVWIDVNNPSTCRKIGAIGIRCSRFITMHGLALNINTDLSYFSLINPCGFTDKGVTSLEKETGKKADINMVKEQLKQLFTEIFSPKRP